MDRLKEIIREIISRRSRYRRILLSLSCVVVFVTTYLLILPAITLEKDKAAEQGGIDVPAAAVEETVDENTTDPDIEIDTDTETDIDKDIDKNIETDTAADSDSEEASDPGAKDSDKQATDEKDGSVKAAKDTKYTKPEELLFEGDDYTVTVIDKNSILPEAALVESEEIRSEDSKQKKAYDEYVSKTEEALGLDEGTVSYARVFDIKIVDSEGNKYDIPEPVDVSIKLADRDNSKSTKGSKKSEPASAEDLQVVHFEDGAEEGEVIESVTENEEDGSVVEFEAEGFSVYSIVEAPEPVPVYQTVSTLDDIEADQTYYLSIARGGTNYMTSTAVQNGGTFELKGDTNKENGEEWLFEFPEDGKIYIYYLNSDNEKKYLNVDNTRNISFSETPQALSIEPTKNADAGTFYIYTVINNKNYALSVRGNRNFFFEGRNNGDNANERVVLTKHMNDPYKLNGKSFGIAYNDNSTKAAAMMAENSAPNHLPGLDMLIRPDVLNNSGNLLVAENSEIQEWTFESAGEDKYYIKTTVEGTEKYIRINGGNVRLVDKSSASEIQAIPGTDANSGKWHFTVGGRSLNFNGSAANGFNAAGGSNETTWLNLVEKSTLTEADFVEYSARKISASDDILSATEKDEDGQIKHDDEGNVVYKEEKTKVVIYTRVWNEETRKYEFYAVDHDGSLIRVYDSGDLINWVGNQVNSALWEFTEYTNADGTPSYFYELENTAYSGKYLAPQSDGIISDQPVGINLNGRKEGFDYTSIVAWDDDAYAYSGLKIVHNEDGSLKAVTCPLDEADDFHFAVIVPPEIPPEGDAASVTTVETVDNDKYGISIKMIDFNNRIDKDNRDTVQRSYFGYHKWEQSQAFDTEKGLVSTNLEDDGYPIITAKTEKEGSSMSGLFNDMTPANHLFIQSVYNESGYFEYDSTQNFAHLNDDGNFTVYNQLGAIGTTVSPTRSHGQFMPYNDISAETGYAHDDQGNVITNQRDIKGNELPDTDPRKGEPLYLIPQNEADYFYGMELSAVFTQTPDGVDDWGHDIIFEFTGDDDFWFYVDGELVLDLGGVHSAVGGSVNFRTGEVICNNVPTTLYEIFRKNYQARGKDPDEADALFVTKTVDGQTVHVFNDYTSHKMKMFYMERGAGASNLKMRFNLASVKPGTVELSKKLKGVDNESNKLIQYPYQIWYQKPVYKEDAQGQYILDDNGNYVVEHYDTVPLEQASSNTDLTGKAYVAYKGTKTLIPYKESMTIGGITYNNVFLIKAGEEAVINFPEDTYRYKIVECGLDTAVYNHVYINGDQSGNEIFGKPYRNTDGWDHSSEEETLPSQTATYEESTRSDFGIKYDSTNSRPRVEYTNEVHSEAMRTVSFKKVLYDSEGELIPDAQAAQSEAVFSFRLSLGNEFADQNNLSLADMYTYYVKGVDGKYCKWDKESKKFVSLGVDTFEQFRGLPKVDQRAGTFTTSMYGSISKIPAGYTVEVRDLVVGTKYKIEEPDREIPKGYTRRDSDGYVRTDLAEGNVVYYTDADDTYGRHPEAGNKVTAEPISDTIADKTESPVIEIRNQEGWGLTAKKEWTDKDFVTHDPIYMAVYLDEEQSESDPVLIEDTVRRLNAGVTEVYWFFEDLKLGGEEPHTFDEFIVREVILDNPKVNDSTGEVTDYNNITPVNEGGSISVIGRTHSDTDGTENNYTVNYEIGESTGQNEKIRIDTVTNSRPGIQIYKTDWNGENYLSGAVFTLKDTNGSDVGQASYTSDANGLVTTAYLTEGTFTLDEIKTPFGYAALDKPITIKVTTTKPSHYDLTVTEGSTTYYITLNGPEDFYTVTEATESSMARITVKNRTVQELKVVKVGVDGSTKTTLSGVHFALYDQVRDSEGNVRPAYNPKSGYEDIVTDDDGVLNEIKMSLGTGTYYLREKEAPSGYKKLAEDLCFSIGRGGTVTINNAGYASWLTRDTSVSGKVSYQIGVENTPLGITVRKTDEKDNSLPGSKFVLYRKNSEGKFVPVTGYGLGENGVIDLTEKAEMNFTGMINGAYKLTETDAPPGYVILENDIFFNVSDGAMTLTDEYGNTKEYSNASLSDNNTTIAVKNTPGASLPNAGGPGTKLFYIFGTILTAGCAILLIARRRVGAGAGKRS